MRASTREQVEHDFRKYGPVVYRRCLHLLTDKRAAQDATRDVFLNLLRQPDRFEEPATVLAWVYRAATQHCMNVLG